MNNIRMRQLLFFTMIFILSTSSVTFAKNIGIENDVSAYLLGDFESGQIVEEYNIDVPLAIASITKFMTYTVVMDEIEKGNISMRDRVVIDKETEEISGSTFDLKEGEKFSVKTLLESALIVSANDSCVALAKYTAGDVSNFVNKMNEKAKEIGLENTNYLNPNGLPEKYGQNTMSVRDIFKLSRYILEEYPEVLKITKKPKMSMGIGLNTKDREFINKNTNPLLEEIDGVDGLKTGFTNEAGYCLVSTISVKGRFGCKDSRLIGIVMGTESEEKRNETSKNLLDYGISNYENKEIEVFQDGDLVKDNFIFRIVREIIDFVIS